MRPLDSSISQWLLETFRACVLLCLGGVYMCSRGSVHVCGNQRLALGFFLDAPHLYILKHFHVPSSGVCAHTRMCVNVWVHMCMDAWGHRLMLGIFPHCFSILFTSQGLSMKPRACQSHYSH